MCTSGEKCVQLFGDRFTEDASSTRKYEKQNQEMSDFDSRPAQPNKPTEQNNMTERIKVRTVKA